MSPTVPASDRPAADAATPVRVVVIIPAKDEELRIAATVRAALQLPGVDRVVVVDDGSTDATATEAHTAGARVLIHPQNRGKAAAMTTGARDVQRTDAESGRDKGVRRAMLFLDADLEDSAAAAAPLTGPILDGSADMSIATLPEQKTAGGGRGLVVGLASDGIERATGWVPRQPLSGQRCITSEAFQAALPLAKGFGVETGLTIDLLRAGYRVEEVEVDLHHRVTGKDWKSQVHRGRQYAHVMRALLARGAAPTPGRNKGSK